MAENCNKMIHILNQVNQQLQEWLKLKEKYDPREQVEAFRQAEKDIMENIDLDDDDQLDEIDNNLKQQIPAMYKLQVGLDELTTFRPHPERYELCKKIVQFIELYTALNDGEIFYNGLDEEEINSTDVRIGFVVPSLDISRTTYPHGTVQTYNVMSDNWVFSFIPYLLKNLSEINVVATQEDYGDALCINLFVANVFVNDGIPLNKKNEGD